ncbi:MAG: hypothetical protein M3295_05215 [Chloroflexota bacterium]|nr:hypothetical protein [Chloroflexota bacterium]
MADGAPGRFRIPILIGCVLMIVSGFLPWWRAGGDSVGGVPLPATTGLGLQGPGLVVYAVAIGALLLLDVGYMRGRYGFILDAPLTYLLLGLVAGAALAFRGYELVSLSFLPFPDRAPGFAAAVAGVAFILYGAGTGLTSDAGPRY